MPKKKVKMKKPTELLEKREHLGVNYEIWETSDALEYRVTKGLEPFRITGSSKRSLTVQIKKEIEVRLEAQKRQQKEPDPPEDIDLGISAEEEDEIFDMGQYDPDGKESEEVAIETSVPQEIEGSDLGATSSDIDSSERRTVTSEKISKTDVDAYSDEKDWEETPQEENIESADISENETELESGLEKDSTLPFTEPPVPTTFRHDYPNVLPHELRLSCVVVDGKMYGKIGKSTYITVKKNAFLRISEKKFAEMRRGKAVRSIPLKIKDVPLELDSELVLRFLVVENQGLKVKPFYRLGKGGGALWVIPNDKYPGSPIMDFDNGVMYDSSHFVGLISPKTAKKFLVGAEIITKRTFPSDILYCFNDKANVMKDIYQKASSILENRGNTRYINPDNILIFRDIQTENLVIIAPYGGSQDDSDDDLGEEDIEEVSEEEE